MKESLLSLIKQPEPIDKPKEPEATFADLMPLLGLLFIGQIVLVLIIYLLCKALSKSKTRPDNILHP